MSNFIVMLSAIAVAGLIIFCTAKVIGNFMKSKLNNFKNPSVIKIVTPIIDKSRDMFVTAWDSSKNIYRKYIHRGKVVGYKTDYFFKKSRKERKEDKEYEERLREREKRYDSFIKDDIKRDKKKYEKSKEKYEKSKQTFKGDNKQRDDDMFESNMF